ncbi:unnamed protein product, partial [Linum tenue]
MKRVSSPPNPGQVSKLAPSNFFTSMESSRAAIKALFKLANLNLNILQNLYQTKLSLLKLANLNLNIHSSWCYREVHVPRAV